MHLSKPSWDTRWLHDNMLHTNVPIDHFCDSNKERALYASNFLSYFSEIKTLPAVINSSDALRATTSTGAVWANRVA